MSDSDSKMKEERHQARQMTSARLMFLRNAASERAKACTMVFPSGMTVARVRPNPIGLNWLMELTLRMRTEVSGVIRLSTAGAASRSKNNNILFFLKLISP